MAVPAIGWKKTRKLLGRVLIPGIERLPIPTAFRVSGELGRFAYHNLRPTRMRFDHAVECWARHFGEHWSPSGLGQALAENELRWQLRDVLLDRVPDHVLDRYVVVEGRENLDRAASAGRGVIVLGNHFGAQMQPAHWLLRTGYPLRLYMERPRRISKYLGRSFDLDGPLGQKRLFISRSSTAADSAGSILRATRILGAGMVLLMAGDVRWAGSHTVEARFLGREDRFSATWAILAGMARAPVVPVFSQIEPEGRYRITFQEPWRIGSEAVQPQGLPACVSRSLEAIEAWMRRDPSNGNEYVRWLESGSAAEPRRTRRAA